MEPEFQLVNLDIPDYFNPQSLQDGNTQQNFNQAYNHNQFSSLLNQENPYYYDEYQTDGPLVYSYSLINNNPHHHFSTVFQMNTLQSTCESNTNQQHSYQSGESSALQKYNQSHDQFYGQSCDQPHAFQEHNQSQVSQQQQSQQKNVSKKPKRDYKKISSLLDAKIQIYLSKKIADANDENYLTIKNWYDSRKNVTNKLYQSIYQNQSGLSIICFPDHTFESISSNEDAQMIFCHFLQKTQAKKPSIFNQYIKNTSQEQLDLNINCFNKICGFNKRMVLELRDEKQEMEDQISYFIDNIYQKVYKKQKKSKI
ncbi:hypothetical protein TTHERM_00340250 (macronuclear) [Tetrahymena thermophila SB210]|uniref:Uncharacterized protein n=1 Tax=Tetrahymena thermophila (strain SB210) TaxID=312017 RepID=I7M899_TETTS|nr:hypothetical protein TTHERM_00340250 [Tetrahymena thermophila SB210]EAR97443.3 hypothetical protein TTHERM_00340250 [Tetrahymena thermophila SB210]|eukprot:XP_001017688.3 hypothetical protein TTHERM_00340250 [Tetrahymena thermophila SB210]